MKDKPSKQQQFPRIFDQEQRFPQIMTEEMIASIEEGMIAANDEGIVTEAGVIDSAGVIGCAVFIVPVCYIADVKAAISLHRAAHDKARRDRDGR